MYNHKTKKRIFIVEDNLIVSLELKDQLMRYGYEIAGIAINADEAVEKCSAERPDLILMDIMLKGNMSGIDAVAEIHKSHDAPVIYITASSDRDTVEKAKATTPYGYLVKPIDEKELIIAIEMAFARSEFEMQLEESEAKFRNLFEDSKDAIYIWKKDSGYLEFNQSMIDLFGYTADEMRKIRLRDFFPDRENLRKYLRTIKESGYVKDLNLKMRKKDGSVIVCIASTSVLKDPQGRFNGFQGIIRDITDLQLSIDRINGAMNGIIKAISNTVEKRDPYTAGHQKRVADISTAIGKIINMSEDRIKGLEMAALIHDLGKIHIPYEILNKPGRLSRIEFELIKSHPGVGYEILKSIDFPWPIADIVHQHHERMNGSGYPEGLSDGGILLESRIVSVADVVESMASHRPYRPAVGIEAALDEIKMNRGVLYDPEIVDACILLFIDKGFTLDMRW